MNSDSHSYLLMFLFFGIFQYFPHVKKSNLTKSAAWKEKKNWRKKNNDSLKLTGLYKRIYE